MPKRSRNNITTLDVSSESSSAVKVTDSQYDALISKTICKLRLNLNPKKIQYEVDNAREVLISAVNERSKRGNNILIFQGVTFASYPGMESPLVACNTSEVSPEEACNLVLNIIKKDFEENSKEAKSTWEPLAKKDLTIKYFLNRFQKEQGLSNRYEQSLFNNTNQEEFKAYVAKPEFVEIKKNFEKIKKNFEESLIDPEVQFKTPHLKNKKAFAQKREEFIEGTREFSKSKDGKKVKFVEEYHESLLIP